MTGAVPLVVEMFAVPLFNPKQVTFEEVVLEIIGPGAFEIKATVVDVHPFASLMTMLYDPAAIPLYVADCW